MSGGLPWRARTLGQRDIRASFALARSLEPALGLTAWSSRLRRNARSRRTVIGVSNAAGCLVALVTVSDGAITAAGLSAICAFAEDEIAAAALAAWRDGRRL
jgi:hypothetical protein